MNRSTPPFIAAYLVAIVLANLAVTLAPAEWRAAVVTLNSLLLIALDLTAGDRLHEAWRWREMDIRVTRPQFAIWVTLSGTIALPLRFGLLIAAGSLLSYALNGAAGPVALVSCVAFALSATSDRLIYGALYRYGWYARVNGSNIVSALADSTTFLGGLALFGLLPWSSVPILVAAQWMAKVAGGAFWSVMFKRRLAPVAAEEV